MSRKKLKKVYIVKVVPESKKEYIELKDDYLIVYVSAEAAHGFANARMIQLLAVHFKVPPARIAIIAGHKSKTKKVVINE